MPRLDGTGPQGAGPMTGRGEGYCAIRLPDKPGQPAYGYAGLQGRPVRPDTARLALARRLPLYRRSPRTAMQPGQPLVRGQRRGARRGRRFGGR